MEPRPFLKDTAWLDRNLEAPDLVVLDCNWHLPDSGTSGIEEFRRGHIPGARHFDLDTVSDPDSPYANMLPSEERFAGYVGGLGVSSTSSVVVYDAGYVSARVWWMFRTFGHDDVSILDGGWRRWLAEGRPVETGDGRMPARARFAARRRAGQVAGWREVLDAVTHGEAEIVDARTPGRFTGEMPSGYPGVPGGHMPGAKNIPWSKLIEQDGEFRFVEAERAADLFRQAGVDLERPIVATCGSGVTAAVLGLMLERIGKTDWKLYDGSWHEWGQRDDLPKETG